MTLTKYLLTDAGITAGGVIKDTSSSDEWVTVSGTSSDPYIRVTEDMINNAGPDMVLNLKTAYAIKTPSNVTTYWNVSMNNASFTATAGQTLIVAKDKEFYVQFEGGQSTNEQTWKANHAGIASMTLDKTNSTYEPIDVDSSGNISETTCKYIYKVKLGADIETGDLTKVFTANTKLEILACGIRRALRWKVRNSTSASTRPSENRRVSLSK